MCFSVAEIGSGPQDIQDPTGSYRGIFQYVQYSISSKHGAVTKSSCGRMGYEPTRMRI